MTLTQAQGHWVTLKFRETNILETINTGEMKLGPKVVSGKTFKGMQLQMTLTRRQGHWVTLKFGKTNISETINTGETKHGLQKVCNCKTFKSMQLQMTLTLFKVTR